MPTAQQMINRAYRLSGELASGETLAAEDSADALVDLNVMLDSWQIQRLFVYQILQRSLTWPAATTSRTIGSGGNFAVARPDRIESAFVTVDGFDYPMTVIREREQYDRIPDKTSTTTQPEALFYDPAFSSSLGTLYIYPVPSAEITVKINVWNTLQTFASLGTDLALPPGYQQAIETSLAETVCVSVGLQVPQQLARMAMQARKAIKALNAPWATLTSEIGLMTRRTSGNIISGE